MGYVSFVYCKGDPVVSSHSLRVTVATHATARGLRVTRMSEYTKMRSCSHDSVPIAEKIVPIGIETQARGFMEDKAAIFPG